MIGNPTRVHVIKNQMTGELKLYSGDVNIEQLQARYNYMDGWIDPVKAWLLVDTEVESEENL